MNDRDKAVARWALQRNRLTIDQVEQIRVEVDRSGRPFKDVAVGRGLLSASDFLPPPPKKIPPVYFVLLACSFVIFAGLLYASIHRARERTHKDEELALESEKSNVEAERKAGEARRGYNQALVTARETSARDQLAKARAAMARVEAMLASGTLPPEIAVALNEAFVGYNMYLKVFPEDAAACIERSRTHELRRNYDLAIEDLEHAIRLKPELDAALRDRIARFKQMLSRKPQ
ncbi:MAG: hypothetical protein HY293_17545 [Planctomycetes bacterium]|nr:hypothetical protein [Planctomycetota bacterium]